jgi:hypothetical protein
LLRDLTEQQCLDRVKACSKKLTTLKGQAGGSRQVHLQDCLIRAKASGNEDRCKGILKTVGQEEQTLIWCRINQAIDDPLLRAVPFIQQMEHGEVMDIYKMEEMNREI